MDITNFFTPQINRNTSLLKEYNILLGKMIAEKKIDMLEFSYMINFGKISGTMVNIEWFIKILNRINDISTNKICVNLFNKLLTISDTSEKIDFNIEKIFNQIINKEGIIFTEDQKNGIKELLIFLTDLNQKCYGFYGYAGTGKTTTLVEFVGYMCLNGYIKSVALTAPTNKAVNVIKSKFLPHLKLMASKLLKINNFDTEDVLDILLEKGIKIEFITIHRLLNFKNDINMDGDRVFVRNGKSHICDYEMIFIDECSMIPLNMVANIFDELRNTNMQKGDNYKKVPKIVFSGDKAQLPPVNNKISALFINNIKDINLNEYKESQKTLNNNNIIVQETDNQINDKFNELKKDILNMKSITMKQVVRNKIENITNLCYNVRLWVCY